MSDMSRWDGELSQARAEQRAQEAAFHRSAWMPEEQRLAASRQTYPRLQEAAAWAIARYREAGVPGQGRRGARRWPVGHAEVPTGPDPYGRPGSRTAVLWTDGEGGLFPSDEQGEPSRTRLSPDDVGDFLLKDGNSLNVAQVVHHAIGSYEEWKAENGNRRFKVKVTVHPVRLVVFLVILAFLAYYWR